MDFTNIPLLAALNDQERSLEEIQEDINRARRKYFDVSEIQLHLDRRQSALDAKKKSIMDAKGHVVSPN